MDVVVNTAVDWTVGDRFLWEGKRYVVHEVRPTHDGTSANLVGWPASARWVRTGTRPLAWIRCTQAERA
jgi:hypothetical protein